MHDVEIRTPHLADADAVGRMHAAAWREAYGELLPPEFWAGFNDERRIERWRRNLTDPPDGVRMRIAVRAGDVVGLATAGPTRANPSVPTAARGLELYALYVLASEYGTGLGRRLLDAVIAPDAPAELWVFEANARARAFYLRAGFAPDGSRHVFDAALGNLPELRMVR